MINVIARIHSFFLLIVLAAMPLAAAENSQRPHSQQVVKPEVKKVKVNGIEIAYYLRGTGQPLLMINGYKSNMAKWDPALLELLEQHYQLILFDNRGVGFSTDSVEDLTTMPQMADDAAALVKALGLKNVYALGWSMGARIAQQLAIRHPDLVQKLILCAPNAGGKHQFPASAEITAKLNAVNATQQEAVEILFPLNAEGKKAALAYEQRVLAAVRSGSVPDDLVVSRETALRQNQARGQLWDDLDSNYEDLAKLTIPTLVVDGKLDVIDPPENVRMIANQIPFAWAVYLNGGHAFLFEDSQRFADLVHLFLE